MSVLRTFEFTDVINTESLEKQHSKSILSANKSQSSVTSYLTNLAIFFKNVPNPQAVHGLTMTSPPLYFI